MLFQTLICVDTNVLEQHKRAAVLVALSLKILKGQRLAGSGLGRSVRGGLCKHTSLLVAVAKMLNSIHMKLFFILDHCNRTY